MKPLVCSLNSYHRWSVLVGLCFLRRATFTWNRKRFIPNSKHQALIHLSTLNVGCKYSRLNTYYQKTHFCSFWTMLKVRSVLNLLSSIKILRCVQTLNTFEWVFLTYILSFSIQAVSASHTIFAYFVPHNLNWKNYSWQLNKAGAQNYIFITHPQLHHKL